MTELVNHDKEKYLQVNKTWRQKNPHRTHNSHLKRLYGISLVDYNLMLEDQDYKCAICFKIEIDGRAFSVDHNHQTGKIRGLLCHHCNRGLGQFKESTIIIEQAIKYLEKGNN